MGQTLRFTVLGLFAAAGVIACSGTDAAVDGQGASSTDEALMKVGACLTDTLGGPTSCKDASTWKKYASDACATRGLDLADLSPGAACAGGTSDVKFSCCKPEPKPLPVPPPAICFGDVQGGPTSCKTSADWKRYANDACVAKKSTLRDIGYGDSCGKDEYRFVKYECCDDKTPPPPPPPPPACTTTELGDKTTCEDAATLKTEALDVCAKTKSTLTAFELGSACLTILPGGGYTGAKVTCCAAVPPPPPPPACDWQELGGATSCKDATTWKQYAIDTCTKAGERLGDIELGPVCDAAGDTSAVKFSCCK